MNSRHFKQLPAATAARIGLLLLNSWLVGLAVNWPNFHYGGSISELSVAGQPGAWFFRLSDLFSGILLLVAGYWLASFQRQAGLRRLFLGAIVVFGLGNMVDAALPLSCSAALDPICRQQELANHLSLQDGVHILESLLVVLAMGSMILSSFCKGSHLPRSLKQFGQLLLYGGGLIWATDTIWRIIHHQEGFGYLQRVAFICFTVWLWLLINHQEKGARRMRQEARE